VSASHTYATGGTYTVTLTVTDDDGATDTATKQVTVTGPPPANVTPTAVIGSPDITGLSVKVSGSGSSDSDGTIAGYAWTYGDGGTATGVSPAAHVYATGGTYTITLTVTDDDGATDSATRQVTVTAPPTDTALARDAFGRTTSNGWGSADVGGSWTFNGTTNRFSVAGGKGLQALTSPGNTADAQLASVSAASAEVRVTLAWSRTGSGGTIYGSVLPRRVSSSTDYRCKVVSGSNGVIQVILVRRVSGTETAIGSTNVSGFTLAANQAYDVACSATPSGTGTLLRAKLWRDGTTEPSAWQVSATDSTAALQVAGGIGISSYMSSSATLPITLSVDDLVAVTP
jgi:PKD repeat protein